jgi:hypothetical protein
MRKSHIRDYATSAFQFYAKCGSLKRYIDKVKEEVISEQGEGSGTGISTPTEATQERVDKRLNEIRSELWDLEAVENTVRRLELSMGGTDKLKALRTVYIQEAQIDKGDIKLRVHKAEIGIPASEKTIYRWLADARRIFAEERELRM